MSVGIIRYPGSNCDYDTLNYFEDSFFIWHKESSMTESAYKKLKLLVIPGGFAFGDRSYISATEEYTHIPGLQAVNSPVTDIIFEAHKREIPILGICNGFQILTHLNLLPGRLSLNFKGKFQSQVVNCILDSKFFNTNKNISIPIANAYGKYTISFDEHKKINKNNQIFLRYDDFNNGSYDKIAGVCNENHTIFGLMPHPERINDYTTKNYMRELFCNIIEYKKLYKSRKIKETITRIMSSEHVSYKSTKKFLQKLYSEGDHVVQGPGENAGIIDIGNGYCIASRIESHNHPIFIDPFQGAATGVGGILRDIFTMGARPIAILDFLRFGTDENNERLSKETIKGISYYGNCVGVANVGGQFQKNPIYNKNPLLNVACLGIVKKENIIYGHGLTPGNKIVYVGSRTGYEGVGGADMASKTFKSNSSKKLKDNIQTGDPFLEKLLLEACLEITESKLVEGMQDMGAGGILCSSVELIQRGRKKTNKNLGCYINIDTIPVKTDMKIQDILISESQERMLLVCSPTNVNSILNVFKKWDLQAHEIGEVTEDGKYIISKDSTNVYSQDFTDFIYPTQDWPEKVNISKYEKNINVSDTEIWKQYDHTIGNRTMVSSHTENEYDNMALLNLPEINNNLVITWGETLQECLDTMLENYANPLAVINCLNFGDPENCIKDIRESIEKLNEDCKKNKIPIIGGNVSLYNATDGVSIKPTVILVLLGIEDKELLKADKLIE